MESTVRSCDNVFILAGDESGALEFGGAESCEFQQIRAFAFAPVQFVKARPDFFRARVAFAIRREFVIEVCVAIENLAMALGAEQRMLLVLSVDLHQRRADFAEALHRGEFAVDRHARASAALGDHPAHDQLAARAVAFARGQFRHRSLALELEQSLDDCFLLAGANHIGRRARAEQQSERAQDDRFAGAGLARKHVEAGAELEMSFLDDREVAYVQFEQHPGRARLSPVELVAPDFEIRMFGADQRDDVAPAMNFDYVVADPVATTPGRRR